MITNGLNGHLLSEAWVRSLSWIDVSLDGGRRTYEGYRGGSWEKLVRSIGEMRRRGLKELRVLQTLSTATVASVGDMLETAIDLGASLIVFSPYQPTRSFGQQAAVPISPAEFVRTLEPFAENRRVYLSFDVGYAGQFADASEAVALAEEAFGDRFTYVDSDPIDRGLIRVTYDGLVLTPFQAINTEDYSKVGHPVLAKSLNSWFGELSHPAAVN